MARIIIKKADPAPTLDEPHLASGVGAEPNSYPYTRDEALVEEAKTNIRDAKGTLQTPARPGTWFGALTEFVLGLIESARLRPLAYSLGCLALLGVMVVCVSLYLVVRVLSR